MIRYHPQPFSRCLSLW